MTKHYLTKSNFKLGVECKQKLKYYKAKYPSSLQDNDMLEFFPDGGFMVEAIAHGVMLHANPAAEFEVTLKHDRYQARVDGWEQFATHAVLTEIKATSVESDDPAQFFTKNGDVNSSWRPYLLDITFQVMVARLVHPGLEIRPQLCVVNKTKRTSLEGIYKNIDIVDDKDADREKPRAVFTGDGKTLYTGHTVRGWGKLAEGLQRTTWQGVMPFDVKMISLQKEGFALKFTLPLGSFDPQDYEIRSFRYQAKWSYGGPMLDERPDQATAEKAGEDAVFIRVENLEPKRVYQITLKNVPSQGGEPLANEVFYYTLNSLRVD